MALTRPAWELGASEVSGASVDRPRVGFSFRSAIEPLIAKDFEQVAAVVERLAAKPLRGLGRIEVAKLFLQNNK
jgi:hypothetical protein